MLAPIDTSVMRWYDFAAEWPKLAVACLAALACWISVAWGACQIIGRRLAEEPLAVRAATTGVIAIAFVICVMTGLGHANLLGIIPVTLSCLALAVAAYFVRPSDSQIPNLHVDMVNWTGERMREGYAVAFCVVAVLAFQAVMRALRCPPLSWDSLTYHAFLPARWIQLEGLAPFAAPGGMDGYRALPWNMELLAAFAILPFKSDLALNLVNLGIFPIAAVVSFAIARELGAKPGFALWAPLLFCTAPPVWHLATTQYNDVLVAAMLGGGILFLIRWHRTSKGALLIAAGAAFGIACGTKYTALPVSLAALVFVIVRICIGQHQISGTYKTLLIAVAVALACGADRYIQNIREFGNPVYPFEVVLAGHTLFDGSPMQAEILHSTPRGHRIDDWPVVKSMFSSGRITWGPIWLLVLPVALASSFFLPRDHSNAKLRRIHAALALLILFALVSYFLPDDGIPERTRRQFHGSSQRMLALPMMLAATLASTVAYRWKWPAGVAPVIPTAFVLINVWNGKFPQPPSLTETCLVTLASIISLCVVNGPRIEQLRLLTWRNPWRRAVIALILFSAVVPAVFFLESKRNQSRYSHYAASTDYHDIPRYLTGAWQAVDDPNHPLVVALVDQRNDRSDRRITRAALEWFFYPLLGSRLQNRVVHPSVFEQADIPSRAFWGGNQPCTDAAPWLHNLERLSVDRIVVTPHAHPELDWIEARPHLFQTVRLDPDVRVYAVNKSALAASNLHFDQTAAIDSNLEDPEEK